MTDSIIKLCALGGISGRENDVRDYIISQLPEKVSYNVDAIGNLIVDIKGKKPAKNKVLLAAHMDEVGMIVTHITSDGFIKFANIGGIECAVQLGKRVKVGEDGLTGVIGVTPIHLRRGDDEYKLPKTEEMYIDVGAENADELKGKVYPGDKIIFDSDAVEFGSLLKAKAIDDRAGCAVLLEMIRNGVEYDTVFAFTVQEEVGTRGASCAAFAVAPDFAVVVETTTAADISGVSGEKQVCHLGEGAVVPFMDAGTVYSPELYALCNKLAKENDFRIQTKSVVAGGNDARTISTSRDGVKTVTVSFATRYLHSPSCVINKDDIAQIYKAVKVISEEFANA